MDKPIIGITSSRERIKTNHFRIAVPEAYSVAVTRAGGIPLIIPLGLSEESLKSILLKLDGLLFSGGGDVHPKRYGSRMDPLVRGVDEDRDRVEIFLVQEACQADIPFLGICRGLQTINVALGGTLYEDILDQRPDALNHQFSGIQPRDYYAHPVSLRQESSLAGILGGVLVEVNSLHHQGIRQLGERIIDTAWAPDGLIEAIEAPACRFGLAVQWHPESLPNDPAMQNLFKALVDAAQT